LLFSGFEATDFDFMVLTIFIFSYSLTEVIALKKLKKLKQAELHKIKTLLVILM